MRPKRRFRPASATLAGSLAALLAAGAVLGGATAAAARDSADRGSAAAADRARRLVDRSPDLVRPLALTVDGSLGTRRAAQEVRLAQQLYTFWNTGEQRYLDAAVDRDFRDNTLPAGRPQGPTGPAVAARAFRAAVPDLRCELADLLVTGDKLTARLVFRGHFTGVFQGRAGRGQAVEFTAIDIQHVGARRITEDWHIEDNTTLLAQLGAATG
ncbi:Predicted ester cyclase [Streptomyces sp. TLI_053]|uniref:ester cyclase n=1 Tax=Streptomyces sp. TLI_053 TaxID=1855352 RepID=UPI000879EF01|nr:ester cyclase [Streptomyces sp. TLI_053]SDT79513.1 Predicted ester cyclase [Streptomyces sp. TLI_053]